MPLLNQFLNIFGLSGMLKMANNRLSQAVAGTDYVLPAGNITGSAGSLSATVTSGALWGGQGSGVPSSVTVSTGLDLTNGVLTATGGGGGGSPGGTSGQLQYNDAGSFAGFGGWDGHTLTLQSDGTHNPQQWKDGGGSVTLAIGPSGYLYHGTNPFLTADGNDNLFLGDAAGNATLTGIRNVAMGTLAGLNLTTGANNAVFGAYAGSALTTGSGNVLFGQSAGQRLTTGSSNLAFGDNAMSAATTGSSNLAAGGGALENVVDGSFLIGLGGSALGSCTGGTQDAAVGTFTLGSLTVATNCAGFGHNVLPSATGDGNSGFGANAGTAITTGTNNTLLGANSGGSGTTATVSNSTAVGYGVALTIDHQIVLGTAAEHVYAPGGLATGHSVTGSRPSAVVVGQQWYDTTLSKPIWWDGAAWRDAAGTTV